VFSQVESSHKPSADLNTILQAISQASQRYKQKHGKSPVLVIDNLTALAKDDWVTFKKLIQFAKKEADAGRLRVAFVASEGHTPRQVRGILILYDLRKPKESLKVRD